MRDAGVAFGLARRLGKRVVLLGKLGSMAKRDAAALVRRHGATVVEKPDATVHLAVIGEEELPVPEAAGLEDCDVCRWGGSRTRSSAAHAGKTKPLERRGQ